MNENSIRKFDKHLKQKKKLFLLLALYNIEIISLKILNDS